MMDQKLTDRQIEILNAVFKHGDIKEFVEKIDHNKLSFAEIDDICLKLNDEFLLKGIDEDFEANDYGREVEAILDIVNRPRLTEA